MQQICSKMTISRQFSRYFSPLLPRKCQLRPCSSFSGIVNTSGTLQGLNWHKPGDVRHQKMPPDLFAIQKRGFSVRTGGLPEQIERKCQEWQHILQCEVEEKRKSLYSERAGFKLGFCNFLNGPNTSKLYLHTEQLNREQKQKLLQFYPQNRVLEICQAAGDTAKWPIKEGEGGNLVGKLSEHFNNGDFFVMLDRALTWEEEAGLQKCKFDIRPRMDEKFQDTQMAFLKTRDTKWPQMLGYQAMLTAFGCSKQTVNDYGPDPMAEVEQLHAFDQSQKLALGAALNLKRPILAVHGPPGSGKTRLLAEYLNLLRKQGKRAIVVFYQSEQFYNFLPIYYKLSGNNTDFLHLEKFNSELAKKAIEEPAIRALLEQQNLDKFLEDFYKKPAVQNMQKVLDSRRNTIKFEESKQMIFEAKDMEMRAHIEKHAIIFTKKSRSTMNMLSRMGTGFDVAILDGAALMDECTSWWMTVPMAPCLRLFGDHNQGMPTASSQTARLLGHQKSLLQRLDEQFPDEDGFINCHLTRQYRSNPAIQAWPNRVFYGRRAAETDKSVQNALLEDFVPAEVEKQRLATKLVTDPLVMVDLSRLEGEWQEWMFEPERGGRSWKNWGEAILVAFHLALLFKHVPMLPPRQIAHLTLYDSQRNEIGNILGAFYPQFLPRLAGICTDYFPYLQSQQFEVVLQSHVTTPLQLLRNLFHLKEAVFQMTRARRQFLYLTKREWLESGSEQSRALLATFEENGRIVGPNELLALKPGQFEAIKNGAINFFLQNRRK